MVYTPRPKREVTCETCGKTAHTYIPTWRFCSLKCKDDHWNLMRKRLPRPPRPLKHGRAATYNKRGCRCDLCREAWNTVCREYQRAARERKGRMVRSCVVCSVDFNPRCNQLTCGPVCRKVYLGRTGSDASRAEFYGVDYEQIDRLEVFAECGWVCGICKLPVDSAAVSPDPGTPSLDHIRPLSQGGGHVRANVQLAHLYCNIVKGNSLEEAC